MKQLNGKAIYSPKGKAGEYSKYAVSFFCGCSCGCHYCYNKTGRFKATLGGDTPQLKKCFKDETHALEVFEKELKQNLPELQKHGLFFSFTTDPMLPETMSLHGLAVGKCFDNNVSVKILTKRADWVDYILEQPFSEREKKMIAFGWTLTGCDSEEPNASPNKERIEAMRKLHNAGFKVWASIEPIIDFESSAKMIEETRLFCDLYKIGLMSGKKYERIDCMTFVEHFAFVANKVGYKVYFKDSLLKQAGINREDLPSNCITRDYNIFKN